MRYTLKYQMILTIKKMKEQIEKRIAELEQAKLQLVGQFNAIEGALAELRILLTPKIEENANN